MGTPTKLADFFNILLVVEGTIYREPGGTTFDIWNINMLSTGSFTIDVLAYEASQSSTTAAGYFTADLNADGELTWLDADTYFIGTQGPPFWLSTRWSVVTISTTILPSTRTASRRRPVPSR